MPRLAQVVKRLDLHEIIQYMFATRLSTTLAISSIIEFFYIGDYNNINAHCCIGGTSVRDNIDMHMQAEHLVVGAPGRVFDMVPRRAAPCGDYATVGSGGGPHAPLLLNMTYVRCYQSVDRH